MGKGLTRRGPRSHGTKGKGPKRTEKKKWLGRGRVRVKLGRKKTGGSKKQYGQA